MRKLIIMCGLPGSGKTTKAKRIRNAYEKQGFTCKICAIDDFWMKNDKYQFKLDLWKYANLWNRGNVAYHMFHDINVIIVDAVNATNTAVNSYALLAIPFDYKVEIMESDTPWAKDPEECARRCVHNCSKKTIKQFHDNYEE